VLCDGRDISTSQFAAWTGVNNVPDLRGGYLRMAGQNASNAAWDGGTLKGYQEDKTAMPDTAFTASSNTTGRHYHSKFVYDSERDDIPEQYHSYTAGNPSPPMAGMYKHEDPYAGGNQAEGPESELATSRDGDHSHTITVSGGDTETRPKTYSVNFFMKINDAVPPTTTPPADPVQGPVYVQVVQPVKTGPGQMWLNPETGDLYVLINNVDDPSVDPANYQWQQINT
jgi:hypothetical protein